MASQNLSQSTRTTSQNCRDIIFAMPERFPSMYCKHLTPEDESELLYFGSETLTASLRKWQDIRTLCQPASEQPYSTTMTQEQVDIIICCLQTLIPKAEKKPILPDLRSRSWFKEGDAIVSRLVDSNCNYYLSKYDYLIDDWTQLAASPRYTGVVTGAGNGRVMLRLEGVPCRGHDLEYVDFCPFVLHQWEYEYFCGNHEFFYFWRGFSHNDSYADLDALILS